MVQDRVIEKTICDGNNDNGGSVWMDVFVKRGDKSVVICSVAAEVSELESG